MESRRAEQKPISRTYYQLDYGLFVDVVKWRMWKLQQVVKSRMEVERSRQGFICPDCKTEYSTLQALSLLDFSTGLFKCEVCSGILEDNTTSESAIKSQETLSNLMDQCNPILNVLKQTDNLVLPQPLPFDLYQPPDVESEQYDKAIDSNYDNITGEEEQSGANGNGLAVSRDTGIKTGEIHVEFGGDLTKEQELYNREQKVLMKLKQNALPPWHVWSTVSDSIMVPGSLITPEMIKLYLKRDTKSKANYKNRKINHSFYKDQFDSLENRSIERDDCPEDLSNLFTPKAEISVTQGDLLDTNEAVPEDKDISDYYKELGHNLGMSRNKKRKLNGDSDEQTRRFDDLINFKKKDSVKSASVNDSPPENGDISASTLTNGSVVPESGAHTSHIGSPNSSLSNNKGVGQHPSLANNSLILKNLANFLEKKHPDCQIVKVSNVDYKLLDIGQEELSKMTNKEYLEFWNLLHKSIVSVLTDNGVDVKGMDNEIGQITFGILDCAK
ncbi:Transcription initiation factor IIE subunit alpha [Smittium mucronatum]|uniref:Transcription initiation factor IIE subunit alpha n=1 Tax=Smittium mucronatum TaxID=133383 RepID=A0A1R0GNL8_9FUNG|nr:Transcription initiation factor IIE subunit alpha [Smittium mucronatum]OLY78605.1 Transcription initiation factor IIE subunit alpha [Smittium mucronatum]